MEIFPTDVESNKLASWSAFKQVSWKICWFFRG